MRRPSDPAPTATAAGDFALAGAGIERNAPYAPTPDNRPAAVAHPRLPFVGDGRTQMSFGERAALTGILAEVRPLIALEIGSAEGGNLRRIAAHSGHVHSIDVDHTPLGPDLPANVTLHTAESAAVLPPLLEQLSASGEALGFALIDGDHSYEGVQRDLSMVLDARCAADAVVLVHDTWNPEVRAGIVAGGFDTSPNVVYFELDFVPGYVYRRGAAAGAAWGGLGLILCGRGRNAGRRSVQQDLYYEPHEAAQRWTGATRHDSSAGMGER